jgi:hypothetical protein
MKPILMALLLTFFTLNFSTAETVQPKNYEMKELSTAEVTVIKKTEQAGTYTLAFQHLPRRNETQTWIHPDLFIAAYTRYELLDNQADECQSKKEFSKMGKTTLIGNHAQQIEIPVRTFDRIKGAANTNASASNKKNETFCVFQLQNAWIVMSHQTPAMIENQGENLIPLLPSNIEIISKNILVDYIFPGKGLHQEYPVCLSRACYIPVSPHSTSTVFLNSTVLPASFKFKE